MELRDDIGRRRGAAPPRGALFWSLTAMALAQAVFASVPGIDLAVSALFYDPARGFWLARDPALNVLRDGLRALIYLLALPALGIALLACLRRVPLRLGVRPWFFVAACAALGPGLIVNTLLKDHWGRARPADILQFGGSARFTPAFQITDQCARNCSFSSGEAASISMAALLVTVILWPMVSPRARLALAGTAGIVTALGAGLRVAMGRHFLSDVVISILISALVVAGLWRAFDMGRLARAHLSDLRSDLARILTVRPRPALPPRRGRPAPPRPIAARAKAAHRASSL